MLTSTAVQQRSRSLAARAMIAAIVILESDLLVVRGTAILTQSGRVDGVKAWSKILSVYNIDRGILQ